MKVYLAYWCNGEMWEDYYEMVEAVFSSREKAADYIVGKGYRPHECKGEWEKRNMADRYDSAPDEYGNCRSMWISEMEVDA